MKAVVVGSGSWGTALAQVLKDNGHDCIIYGNNLDEVVDIHLYKKNSRYFPEVALHPELDATNDVNIIIDADVIVLSVPTFAVSSVCEQINELTQKKVIIVNTAKGFHPETYERMSEVITRSISSDKLEGVVSLLGPSHAEEVVLRLLTAINAVSDNVSVAKKIQSLFANDYFRVYFSTDVVGCELAVAIKNIIALGSGIASGLGLGDNSRAALLTRGLAEMIRFGVANGANVATFSGLCGIGDLVVTCTSRHSRNFQAGFEIGEANSATYFWENSTKTVEGIKACQIVYEKAIQQNIEMPITTEIYKILYENGVPSECVGRLMTRELKEEGI